MPFIGLFFGKAKLYMVAAAGIVIAIAAALFKARRSGTKAERDKQIKRHMKNLKVAKEEIDASAKRTDTERRQRLKDRKK